MLVSFLVPSPSSSVVVPHWLGLSDKMAFVRASSSGHLKNSSDMIAIVLLVGVFEDKVQQGSGLS